MPKTRTLFVWFLLLLPLAAVPTASTTYDFCFYSSVWPVINSDYCLQQVAAEKQWPGDGTSDHPYRLACGDAQNIRLGGTTLHWLIQGCAIQSGSGKGVTLNGVRNGRILENRFDGSAVGSAQMNLLGQSDVEVRSNTFVGLSSGMALGSAYGAPGSTTGYVIRDNTLATGSISVLNAGWNLIADNELDSHPMTIRDSQGLEVLSNRIHDNPGYGLELLRSTGVRIVGNILEKNQGGGIVFDASHENLIEGNLFKANGDPEKLDAGMVLTRSNRNTITANVFGWDPEQDYGLTLSGSNQSLVYNNYFGVGVSLEQSSETVWNVEKTPGRNIVGGLFLGGNYWNDYVGVDVDGDGFGEVPYGPVPPGTLDPIEPVEKLLGIGSEVEMVTPAVHYGVYDVHPLMKGRVQIDSLEV